MTDTIWKFPLTPDTETIKAPEGAEFLHVGIIERTGEPCLWVRVNPEAPETTYMVDLVPTGGDVDPDFVYVGTFMVEGGLFVFHVFV
jgi:hypothetical protein